MRLEKVPITQSFAYVSGVCAIIISLYNNLVHSNTEIFSTKVACDHINFVSILYLVI